MRLTRKNNGELHKSTTMMFFDENGAYEAMLCFTVNLTALDQAKKMLDSLMNVMPFDSPEAIGSACWTAVSACSRWPNCSWQMASLCRSRKPGRGREAK